MKPTNDKSFFDTNIIVYLYSATERSKQKIAQSLVVDKDKDFISTQVLNEFINVMHHKHKSSISSIQAAINELIQNFTVVQITTLTIERALSLVGRYKYSYFDCLMIATAIENSCSILLTEDLHDKQVVADSLKIINPFK